jgi:hypothetical protein
MMVQHVSDVNVLMDSKDLIVPKKVINYIWILYNDIIRHGVDSSFMVYIYGILVYPHGQNVFYYSPCMQKYNQLNNRLIHGIYSQWTSQCYIAICTQKPMQKLGGKINLVCVCIWIW